MPTRNILLAVLTIHIALIAWGNTSPSSLISPSPKRIALAVQTIQLLQAPIPKKKKVIQQQKASSKRKTTKTKKTPQKKIIKTPAPKKNNNKQLEQLEKNLKKIQKTSHISKRPPKIDTLNLPQFKKLPSPLSISTYNQDLTRFLRMQLKLPEYGDVVVDISLNRYGKLLHWNIVQSVSEKNQQYVTRHFPSVSFPPFKNNFSGEEQRSFRLILSHDW